MRIDSIKNLSSQKSLWELMRFVIVGGAATAVDLSITIVMELFTNFSENVITTTAFLCAFWVSYFGHRYITFKKAGNMGAFFALAISTLLLRNVIVYLLVKYVVSGLPALIVAMAVVTIITYIIAKFKIFKG